MTRRMPAAIAALALAAFAGSTALLPAHATTAGTRNDSFVTFAPATVVDPILFGGEPGLNFDPTTSTGSRSFVDWPVSSRQNIGVLFRSEDGGLTYTKRYADPTSTTEAGPLCTGRQIPTCGGGGGGDTDVNIAENGTIYFSSQESLADQLMGTSFDHGTTFPADHVDPVVSKCGPVDRQWITHWKGTSTVFLAYHVPDVGECINRSDSGGATGSWSVPAGPQVPLVTQSGALVADNTGGIHNKAIYVAYFDAISNPLKGVTFTVAVSTDGAKTFVKHPIPGADPDGNFTKIFLDRKGNIYATWIQGNATMLATSKADAGANKTAPASAWSEPVQVSASPVRISIFSDGVAGDPGRVAVSYYGTTASAKTPDDVKPGQGGWYPYVAVSTDALSAHPTFHQTRIAHRVNQDDNICTAGTTCAATMGNRNLLDYFDLSLDAQGHLGFTWTDTNNATKMGFIKVARQASGPSLYAGQPNAKQTARGNGYTDPAGDAKYPTYGAAIKTASNHPTLDLRGTTVRLKDSKTLEVTMTLASTSGLDRGVPGGGKTLDGATLIQQAKYVTRWDYLGHAYYAGANVAAGTTGDAAPVFYSGEVSNDEGVLAAGGGVTYYGNSYKALKSATGKVVAGKLVIDMPVANVGSPKAGAKLYSVGSYAMLGPTDNAVVLNTLPITVDSTPTFDAALPKAGAAVAVGGSSASHGLTGPAAGGDVASSQPPPVIATTPGVVPASQKPSAIDAKKQSFGSRVAPGIATVAFVVGLAAVYVARRRRATE